MVLLGWMARQAVRGDSLEEEAWIRLHGHELHTLLDDVRSGDRELRELALERYTRLTARAPASIRRRLGRV
jgi:hypothetical protein